MTIQPTALTPIGLLATSVVLSAIVTLRYLIFSGGAYWLCWIENREAWRHLRIEAGFLHASVLKLEFNYSLIASVIFGNSGVLMIVLWQLGWTRIYLNIHERGWLYLLVSIALMAFTHETYFYWTHRWMHRPSVFRLFHKIRHHSINPSPWAAFSFHPLVAVVEALIFPILILVIPVHPAALEDSNYVKRFDQVTSKK